MLCVVSGQRIPTSMALRNALSFQQLLRTTFTSHAQAFGSESMPVSNAPIVLKVCVLGPNGPRIKIRAVQEIVITILHGERLHAMARHISLREHLQTEQTVKREGTFSLVPSIQEDGAPGRTRTCGILLRSYAVQNSKCRCWCRLRGSAPFISPLNWTEVGPSFCTG